MLKITRKIYYMSVEYNNYTKSNRNYRTLCIVALFKYKLLSVRVIHDESTIKSWYTSESL